MKEEYQTLRVDKFEIAQQNYLQELIVKYAGKLDYEYSEFNYGDSEIASSSWTKQQAEARKMFYIYSEVLSDLLALKN